MLRRINMADSRKIKIIVEKHEDGFVAYPCGMKGTVVGQGDTADEALQDVRSAIRFHMETFGPDALDQDGIGPEN
jgi:predicted RNase H-like HicB family nuclease